MRRRRGFQVRGEADGVKDGIGRELATRDRFAVDELLKKSAINEHRLLDMIITICQSPFFRGMADKSTDTP